MLTLHEYSLNNVYFELIFFLCCFVYALRSQSELRGNFDNAKYAIHATTIEAASIHRIVKIETHESMNG